MKTYLDRSGHVLKLSYTSRKETIRNMEHLVVSKKLLRLKAKDNSTLNKEERSAYWNTWKKENYDLLVNQPVTRPPKVIFFMECFMRHPFPRQLSPSCKRFSWRMPATSTLGSIPCSCVLVLPLMLTCCRLVLQSFLVMRTHQVGKIFGNLSFARTPPSTGEK
jgi:hypothetical protein